MLRRAYTRRWKTLNGLRNEVVYDTIIVVVVFPTNVPKTLDIHVQTPKCSAIYPPDESHTV